MKKLKVIGLAVAATIVVSSATALTALAANNHTGTHKQYYSDSISGSSASTSRPNASNRFKGTLDKLVTAGTITAAQETAIQTAISNAVTADKGKVDLNTILGSLVTAGTITADQQTAIVTAIKAEQPGNARFGMRNRFKGTLDKLVTAGTITSAQETAIQTAMSDAMKAGNGKVDLNTVLGSLVTAGTITADQQTAIQSAITTAHSNNGGNAKGFGHMHRNMAASQANSTSA